MRRTVVSAFALLGACSFEHGALQGDNSGDGGSGDGIAPNAPWLTGFAYRKPIAITPPALTTPLAEFPVGIFETADPQLASSARDDGKDIVFTAADGTTRIDDELVTFDGTDGRLEAWVKLSQLSGATAMFMYYGAESQPSTATTTWPSQFMGVWHLDQGVAAADSTPHGHAAFSSTQLKTPASVAGIAGRARSFDGIDDSMSVADPSDGSLDFGMGSFSFSLWVNVTSSNDQFDAALSKGGASNGEPGYCVLLGTANWNVKVHDGSSYRDPVAGTETLGSWVYIAGTVDRTAQQMSAYRNGVRTDMAPLTGVGSANNGDPLTFGPTGVLMPFHGVLDEVRISTGVLSPDWIAAEYANLTSTSFAAIGAQQAQP